MSLNGGYAMIKYNSTQEELQIAYRSKKPVLCYDENRRAHWAVIEETATESVDEETEEPITIYEYSYRLIDEASGGGSLYRHDIYMFNSYFSCVLVTSLYSSSSTPMTKNDFNTFLTTKTGNGYLCSGKIKIDNIICPIIYCQTTGMRYISGDGSTFGTQQHLTESAYDTFTDTVTEV